MPLSSILISVVIPCYNYGAYISETIESVLAQTYLNWEAIIVDDGSVDNTAAIVQRYTAEDSRIKYHYQGNQGLSAARNTGIGLAQGEYIQLLDADDFIAPNKLKIHASILTTDPTVDLVFADAYTFQHSVDTTFPRTFIPFYLAMPPVSGQGQTLALHMAYDNIFLPGCPLFRRSLAKDVGAFDTKLFSLEDWHFWYRAVLKGYNFVYDNRSGTEFYARSHGNNMSGNRYKMWQNRISARQSLISLMQNISRQDATQRILLEPVIRKMQDFLEEEQARFNLLFGNIFTGVFHALRYFQKGRKSWSVWYDSAYWIKERMLGRNRIEF